MDNWEQHLLAQASSGESIRAYCQRLGLSTATFHYHKAKQKRAKKEEVGFIALQSSTPSLFDYEIEYPHGVKLRLSGRLSSEELKTLLYVFLSATYRYYLYAGACDMRKGLDGLCGLIGQHFGQKLTSGAVYVFLNRRGDQLKLLHWECGGLVLYHKRLEAGRFRLPTQIPASQELAWHDLVLLVEGIVVKKIYQSKRYVLKN